MKLQVGPNIADNMVRLDFKKSPDKPENMPSYEIKQSKADEFVKKYNKLGKNMQTFTVASTGVGSIIGYIISNSKSKTVCFFTTIASTVLGAFSGIALSVHKKNNLMNDYQVKEFQGK